jgi:hypothetical protein
MLDTKSMEFLTAQEIKNRASSIYTMTPASHLSANYTHIPTSRVIEDMEKLGWNVTDAKQVRSKKGEGYQKHLVVFRNNDVVINGEDGDVVFPQILLTNSHDGKSAFLFQAGLFRMICENGLVVSTQDFENVRIRHMGYTFEELQEQIKGMVEKLPLTVESMNKMKRTILDSKNITDFATKALESRFTAEQVKEFNVDITKLIEPTRPEDRGSDLWSVFNVIQEKIINGDFEYMMGAKIRKARKIKNFKMDLDVNKKLFEIAHEFIAA